MDQELGGAKIHRVDGCNLHYWLIGPDAAPVVVFTAGATADRRLFRPQVPAVSERYRMLLWDVRGHGLSQPAAESPTAQRAATDLASLLDHLALDRVTVVGQSFGGLVGQELIFRQPERVIAAVMLGTVSLTMGLSKLESLGLAVTPWIVKLCPKPLFRRQVPKLVARTTPAQRTCRHMLHGLSPAAINLIHDALAHSLHEEPGYRIELPLLICYGDEDRLGKGARFAPSWLAREPRAEFAIIPGARHNANLDNPASFNQVLLDFLDRHLPRSD